MTRTHLNSTHEPRFVLAASTTRREPRPMPADIGKARNKVAGSQGRNPHGKRPGARSPSLLVARVELPHFAPRASAPIAPALLRGHEES